MTMLTSQHAGDAFETHQLDNQETNTDGQELPATAFDARDRLRGSLDDTTVRQAVVGSVSRSESVELTG